VFLCTLGSLLMDKIEIADRRNGGVRCAKGADRSVPIERTAAHVAHTWRSWLCANAKFAAVGFPLRNAVWPIRRSASLLYRPIMRRMMWHQSRLDVRHATKQAFESVKLGQLVKP
jgi:hypothetical protein